MSRVQLALRVADLDAAVDFYGRLFQTEPAKRRPGYANFAVAEPPLKLVLIQGEPGRDTVLDHLGVEVATSAEVSSASSRLAAAGLVTEDENDTECCYALQDKVWVQAPGKEPWEIYTVKADADTLSPAGAETCRPSAAECSRSYAGPVTELAQRGGRDGAIRCARYVDGKQVEALPLDGAHADCAGSGGFVWIECTEPTSADIAAVAEEFDAARAQGRR